MSDTKNNVLMIILASFSSLGHMYTCHWLFRALLDITMCTTIMKALECTMLGMQSNQSLTCMYIPPSMPKDYVLFKQASIEMGRKVLNSVVMSSANSDAHLRLNQ